MSPRERVAAALRWEPVDWIPFTVYESKLPTSAVERQLRNDGLCIVDRRAGVFGGGPRGVSWRSESFVRDGRRLERRIFTTAAGELTTVVEPLGYTTWTHEHLYKSVADFEPLLAMIEAETWQPAPEPFLAAGRRWGEDAHQRVGTSNIPIQTLISHYMGSLTFGYEWMDHRAECLALIAALHRSFREICELIADSPAWTVNLGGNHSPSILGRANFEEFVLGPIEEACAILHRGGKLVGSHLDDNNRLWADLVARSSLDYIEALTPSPDCDLTVAEARQVWPDKALWINFPSSLHLADAATVAAVTRQMIRESGDGRGFIVGVTEDVPEHRWEETYTTILRECRAAGPR
ncbi:MAG: hypothetical protein IT204_24800 [Fimbriimonadaceae bacterium]|nr:hypothetical protein [Fimbriimonadaceae bacterium]